MCTALISFDPLSSVPVLLAGIRDEFLDRAWQAPAAHWPDRPTLIGGRDLRAGGTWLAVDPEGPRVSCVLNGRGRMAPEEGRASRGDLPLRAAADGKLGGLGELDLERYDPFHLVYAELGSARLWSWDGAGLTGQTLEPGLHLVVNSGLEGAGWGVDLEGAEADAVAQMSARIAHFRPLLAATRRPEPGPGPAAEAWGSWLPLVDGDGLDPADARALVLRRDLGAGGLWGTTSVSLVALSARGVRYDFSATPGDPGAWTTMISPSAKM